MTRFDRRALFASGAAAALLASAGMSLAGSPRRGGHMRIGVPRSDDVLGPQSRAAVFETLTELTPDGLLQGRLATGWQSDDQARVWEIALRESVTFHDGAPFTAQDAVASLIAAGDRLPGLQEVSAFGAFRLRLELTVGDPQLPIRLANPSLIMGPVDQADLIGTGLYAVRHVSSGGGMVGERVAGHYRDGDAGWAQRVDIVSISDPRVRAQAINENIVDAALLPDRTSLDLNRGARLLPSDSDPILVLQNSVGCPAATVATDTRIAERFWLV